MGRMNITICCILFVLLDGCGHAQPHAVVATLPRRVPVDRLGDKYVLVGRTGQPMFTMTRVTGVVVAPPDKSFHSGPYIRVLRVNGIATEGNIVLPIEPLLGGFGDPSVRRLEVGRMYWLDGCEMGSYVGVPSDVGEPITYQIPFSGFDVWFAATRAEPAPPQ